MTTARAGLATGGTSIQSSASDAKSSLWPSVPPSESRSAPDDSPSRVSVPHTSPAATPRRVVVDSFDLRSSDKADHVSVRDGNAKSPIGKSHAQPSVTSFARPRAGGSVSSAQGPEDRAGPSGDGQRNQLPTDSLPAAPQTDGGDLTATLIDTRWIVRIKDFAFREGDPRHVGEPDPDAPPPSTRRPRGRGYFHGEDVDDDTDSDAPGGWSFMAGGQSASGNFGFDDDPEEDVDELDDTVDDAGTGDHEIEQGSLCVAAFAFQAEGESEMDLFEGDVVRVHERVCNGWVVATKVAFDDEGRLVEHADGDPDEDHVGLCPMAYLRLL